MKFQCLHACRNKIYMIITPNLSRNGKHTRAIIEVVNTYL